MSVPTGTQLKTGAKIINPQNIAASATVVMYPGDVVPHPLDGWHVALQQTTIGPAGHGLAKGASNDQWKYSVGASYSGQGVPPSPGTAPTTYAGAQTGYGNDGRISGGATGAPSF